MRKNAMTTATEGEYHPHPVAPLSVGEGRILPVNTAPFLTPLPAGEGSGVRITCSSVVLAIVSRPRVVTLLNPSPEFQFLDTSSVRISISSVKRQQRDKMAARDSRKDGWLRSPLSRRERVVYTSRSRLMPMTTPPSMDERPHRSRPAAIAIS